MAFSKPTTRENALAQAKKLGLSGVHAMGDGLFHPDKSHKQLAAKMIRDKTK